MPAHRKTLAPPPAADVRSAPPQARNRSIKLRLLIAGGAIAAAAVYIALYLGQAKPAPQVAPPMLPDAHAAVSAPVERPRFVDVEIRATPATATISLDGTLYERNPLALTRAADGRLHRIDAAAAGYAPREVPVAFDANLKIDINLERLRSDVPVRQGYIGKIAIATQLPGCGVAIDGARVGTTPLAEPTVVKIGRHMVDFRCASHAAERRVVDVAAGDTVLVTPAAASAVDANGGQEQVRPSDP